MEETKYQTRRRVNFSTSVKGVVTCDVTVELMDATNEDIIREADNLLIEALAVARRRSTGGE